MASAWSSRHFKTTCRLSGLHLNIPQRGPKVFFRAQAFSCPAQAWQSALSPLQSAAKQTAGVGGSRSGKAEKNEALVLDNCAKTPFSFPQNKTNLARRAYYTDLFGLLCTVENVQLGEDHHQMGSCQSTEATGGNGEVVSPVPDNKRLAESAVVSACT